MATPMENDLPVAVPTNVPIIFVHAFPSRIDTSCVYTAYTKTTMGPGQQCKSCKSSRLKAAFAD